MAKIKTKNAQKRYNLFIYALSFFISVVGMLLILKSRGFYPFKEKSLFVMDMQDQYLEFLRLSDICLQEKTHCFIQAHVPWVAINWG